MRFAPTSGFVLYSCMVGILAVTATAPQNAVAQPAAAKAPIVIGWTGPLTGNSAVLGIDSLQAVKIAFDAANREGGIHGREIKVVAEDDQYMTSKADSAFVKLQTQDKIDALIASTYGGVFSSAGRAEREQIVVIDPLDCNEDIAKLPRHTLCLATQSESISATIAEGIFKARSRGVAILYDEMNPFMLLVEEDLKRRLIEKKIEPIIGSYNPSVSDFKSFLTRVAAKKPDAIVFLGHDPMGQAMSEARKLNIKSQFYTVGTITSPGYQKLAGDAAENARVAYWESPKSKAHDDFIADFTKAAGRPPILELATIPSYDAAQLMVQALKASVDSVGLLDREKFIGFFYSTKNYAGVSGKISFDEDGAVRTIRESLFEFEKGALKPLH